MRFGKFSLLRPWDKKVEALVESSRGVADGRQVEFKVNGVKQDYAMKLGEGGEAFFVFETSAAIPADLQTSPPVSPTTSPEPAPTVPSNRDLSEPEPLDLDDAAPGRGRQLLPISPGAQETNNTRGISCTSDARTGARNSFRFDGGRERPKSGDWSCVPRSSADELLPSPQSQPLDRQSDSLLRVHQAAVLRSMQRSASPPPVTPTEAMARAINLSKKLWVAEIPTRVNDSGDLMLDMTGYKSGEEEALRAEVVARKILAEELEGNYDIGALIGADDKGNLWIYGSEEAKLAAGRKAGLTLDDTAIRPTDAISDPGYHSDDARSDTLVYSPHMRSDSDSAVGLATRPRTLALASGENKSFAKTLRLTSDQLRALDLKPGANSMSFSVNRATCTACMHYWKYDTPIVISDIDGTITKSDALGHVLNMIGRDWTHLGVAKLYTDIVNNGYNIVYLTSRSVGQADTTRAYLNGVVQEGYRLPRGPVIMSPDRTIAALRREIYLRKPEVFKMACLRDIMGLFGKGPGQTPFYAGFGNRLTDALSYRSVNIPSTRIFTINSNAEVSLDLLSLNRYKTGYASMREIVDHFFPPVGLLVPNGGEEFTDFNYWRERPVEIDFSESDSGAASMQSEDDGSEANEELERSYLSREFVEEGVEGSAVGSVGGDEGDDEEETVEVDDEEAESNGATQTPAAKRPVALDLASETTAAAARASRAASPAAPEAPAGSETPSPGVRGEEWGGRSPTLVPNSGRDERQ